MRRVYLKEFITVILQSALPSSHPVVNGLTREKYVCVTFYATATTALTQGALKRSLFHSAYTWLTLEVMLPCIHILQCTLAVTEITHGSRHSGLEGPDAFSSSYSHDSQISSIHHPTWPTCASRLGVIACVKFNFIICRFCALKKQKDRNRERRKRRRRI